MMQGRYEKKNGRYLKAAPKKHFSGRKLLLLLLAVVTVSAAAVGGTVAYLYASKTLDNTFEPVQMMCEVTEDFSDGITKKDVCVMNTSKAPAYIRVKLLPYWYDKESDIIVARQAWTPQFTPGEGWVLGADGCYYYTAPVLPGASTKPLIPELTLKQDEASLSRQVLEILASCIQAEPATAVKTAWSGANGSVTDVQNGKLVISQG